MENVILVIILLPVKYLLKLSGSRNFYRLRMTSLTSTNVFTISCLSIEPPPPRFGKFISTARCKALQSLYCTIRQLFVLFVDYSSTIRGLFVLFVDYSRTIRTIRRLFADYSYYSSTIRTIRTIRFTILVLSIAISVCTSSVPARTFDICGTDCGLIFYRSCFHLDIFTIYIRYFFYIQIIK